MKILMFIKRLFNKKIEKQLDNFVQDMETKKKEKKILTPEERECLRQYGRITSKRPYRTNSTGVRGISKRNGRYLVQIGTNKTNINIGLFDSIEDAIKARESAEEMYFVPERKRLLEKIKQISR